MSLTGRRILVVEDDWHLAEALCQELAASGAEVLGPVPTVDDAHKLLDRTALPDAAVLDVELGEGLSFPLVERLRVDHVPFIFATGRAQHEVQAVFPDALCIGKPLDVRTLTRLLGWA